MAAIAMVGPHSTLPNWKSIRATAANATAMIHTTESNTNNQKWRRRERPSIALLAVRRNSAAPLGL